MASCYRWTLHSEEAVPRVSPWFLTAPAQITNTSQETQKNSRFQTARSLTEPSQPLPQHLPVHAVGAESGVNPCHHWTFSDSDEDEDPEPTHNHAVVCAEEDMGDDPMFRHLQRWLAGRENPGKGASLPAGESGRPGRPTNPGSYGHPEACRKPCAFHSLGKCAKGRTCGYCHHSHEQKQATADKRQRALIRSFSTWALVLVLLPHLRARAVAAGWMDNAAEVLSTLAEVLQRGQHVTQPSKESVDYLNLYFSRLTFGSLMLLLLHHAAEAPWAEGTRLAWEAMREGLPRNLRP